jgi:hypothetical protein
LTAATAEDEGGDENVEKVLGFRRGPLNIAFGDFKFEI